MFVCINLFYTLLFYLYSRNKLSGMYNIRIINRAARSYNNYQIYFLVIILFGWSLDYLVILCVIIFDNLEHVNHTKNSLRTKFIICELGGHIIVSSTRSPIRGWCVAWPAVYETH